MGYRTTDLKGVDGTGANQRVVVWTGTESVGSEASFIYNAGFDQLQLLGSPGSVLLQEGATQPNNAAGYGAVWVRNDTPNTLIFTDGAGVDLQVLLAPNTSVSDQAMLRANGTNGSRYETGNILNNDIGNLVIGSGTDPALVIIEGDAPASVVAGFGYVWVKNNTPNTLMFTDDAAKDQSLQPMYGLGQWAFGNATLGVTSSGTFDTNNATLASITAIRFSSTPVAGTGQVMTNWVDQLPQTGVLYFRDVSDPGGTSVTFPYTSLTFPIGTIAPQFNGNALSTDGTILGTNWSANDYVVTLIPATGSTTLDAAITGGAPDNDVNVPLANPIILRNNAAALVPLTVESTTTQVALAAETNSATSQPIRFTDGTDTGFLGPRILKLKEGATAPVSNGAGEGSFWVRTNGANTAPANPTPWFSDDTNLERRLGMQHTTVSFEISPTTGNTWYTWGAAGPYNDAVWTDSAGTGTAPTTSTWFTRPPLVLIPGDAQIERVLGWYQSESASVGTWEFELVAVGIEDADTAVGTVDPIVDGSINNDLSVTNAKITLISHTINDNTALPTDTNHMIGLYAAYRETTGTPLNVDLRGTLTIYWSTYSLDGWVSDGFADQ